MSKVSSQGPRSNFEIGGGGRGAPLVTQYWGGIKQFFLLILYNFGNIGGGGGEARAPPCPPTPRSLTVKTSMLNNRKI